MLIVKGKYNIAKVFTDKIDDTTYTQILSFLNEPQFGNCKISIMPDCHAGKGCCIGYTQTLTNGIIIPNLVGVDIGCGVTTMNIGKIEVDLPKLDNSIRQIIPLRYNVNNDSNISVLDSDTIDNIIKVCGYIKDDNIDRHLASIGSLGGGNHFIELGMSDEGDKYLTVHSGSRNFGHRVASYFQQKAEELCEAKTTRELKYLTDTQDEYYQYIYCMKVAQKFAEINRFNILSKICYNILKLDVGGVYTNRTIQSVHNYIDFDAGILRKGAVSAGVGEDIVIPFNMRDGMIIAKGKGNQDWNKSAPHGSGRVLSRSQAKAQLNIKDLESEMEGIYTTSIKLSTLDEAPSAYKNTGDILKYVKDTLDVVTYVKPLYNLKG